MRCVAFMRNVNQGQHGHPSSDDIRAGFADAGCPDAVTFQSNGTILFESDAAAKVIAKAEASIAARSGYAREIYWTPLDTLVEVASRYGAVRDPRRFEFALHGGGTIDTNDADATAEADRNRCELVDSGRGWALVRNKIEGEGHATPTIESITGTRASARGLPTVERFVARFARDA
ncbi:DUF1697 domain-containing protein [Microbacterium immunditiarum]|uniref:Uncharacterized protein (DUF1697 family) n=1 Tax=Microbacterium immunditiarum TaxID=337480 RepID=A0A7Y9GMW6_9MICO|nr:DUF1697 domain-containing protein [Microbacterium immunditiarum]NYE19425.1 uncharacterized protein (DUF1697 family) [Microbacterium immunditiarum]